jgi:hypothetical protein
MSNTISTSKQQNFLSHGQPNNHILVGARLIEQLVSMFEEVVANFVPTDSDD